MSIEQLIAENTAAVMKLTAAIYGMSVPVAPAPTVAPTPAPTIPPAPTAPPVTPAVPSFAAPPAVTVPFADAKGLMSYCMGKYSALGPVRGGEIQQVLVGMGHANLNAVRPDQYAEFFVKVEAL